MSLGCPPYGRLLELVWTEQTEAALRAWFEASQLPAYTADQMSGDLGSLLTDRRLRVHDAVKRLGSLLEKLSIRPLEVLTDGKVTLTIGGKA